MSVKQFIQMAIASQGKATFYNTSEEQLAALLQLHLKQLEVDRKNYAACALLPTSVLSKQIICYNLLANTDSRSNDDIEPERTIIQAALDGMTVSQALRFYVNFIAGGSHRLGAKPLQGQMAKKLGIYLWKRLTPFQVVKYASKCKAIVRHCHISPDTGGGTDEELGRAELALWLMGKLTDPSDTNVAALKARLLAGQGDREVLKLLPPNVAQGISRQLGIPAEEFRKVLEGTKAASSRERVAIAHQAKADIEVDYSRLNLLELIRLGHSLDLSPESLADATHSGSMAKWEAIRDAIAAKAAAIKLDIPPKTFFIVDASLSMSGSKEQVNYPIAVAEALARVVMANAEKADPTGPKVGLSFPPYVMSAMDGAGILDWPLTPQGHTDFRPMVVKALQAGAENIIIVSDGYENAGSVAAIAAQPCLGTKFFHLNPVPASEVGGVRRFGEAIKPIVFSMMDGSQGQLQLQQLAEDEGALRPFLTSIWTKVEAGELKEAIAIANFKGSEAKLLGLE